MSQERRRLAAESPIARLGLFVGIIALAAVLIIIGPRVVTSEVGVLNAREAHAVFSEACRNGQKYACVRRDVAARTASSREKGYEAVILAAAGFALFAMFVPMFGGIAAKNVRLRNRPWTMAPVRRAPAPRPMMAAQAAQAEQGRRRKREKYWID